MTEIAILLGAAAVAYGLARWLGLPVIPFLILAGLLANTLAGLPRAFLEDGLLLGVTFLVFVAGIELNPRRVGAQRAAALRVGLVQFAVLGAVGFAAAVGLGFAVHAALYIALALAASSTLVVVRLLQQRKQLFEPFARLVIGVLLLQDVLVILLMPALVGWPAGAWAAAGGVAAAVALLGLAYVSLRWVTPILVLRLGLDDETVLIGILALLFLYVGLADFLRMPIIAGAFLAGVSLSGFPISGIVRSQLSSLSDFFLAIFFTVLGAFLVLPSPVELLQALVFAALIILITPPLVTAVAERSGLSARPALESGLLLSQTSEFSLVIALQGLIAGHVGPEVFTVIVLVTLATMMLTPFLVTDAVTWRLLRWHPVRAAGQPERPPEGHVLLLGCGENGMPLLETLVAGGHDVLVVDEDPAIIERLRAGGIPCIRGDGSDFEVLRAAGAPRAAVIVSTMRRPADSEAVIDYVREDAPVLVRVFEREDAERLARRGAVPILYSEAALEDFLGWFDKSGLARAAHTAAESRR